MLKSNRPVERLEHALIVREHAIQNKTIVAVLFS